MAPSAMTLFLIGRGGALGSIARYLFSSLVLRLSGTLFPVGTFAVNLVGCVTFGTIIGAAQQRFVLTPEKNAFLLKLLELSQDLPIVIEIVDAPDKIEAFMPDLEAMVGDGLITLERAEVLLYRPGRQ